MGERQLLNQYPKIAGHSQLLGWSPSREERGNTNPLTGCEKPPQRGLEATSQEDSAKSKICIYIYFLTEKLFVCYLLISSLKRHQWTENETKHCHLLRGSLWCSGSSTLFGVFWIRLLASCDWSGEVFRWTAGASPLPNTDILGSDEDGLLYLFEIRE